MIVYLSHLRGGYAPIYPLLPWLLRGDTLFLMTTGVSVEQHQACSVPSFKTLSPNPDRFIGLAAARVDPGT